MARKRGKRLDFGTKWEDHFAQLADYREPDGTIHVPYTGLRANRNLWNWCVRQRVLYRSRQLDPTRKARLEKAGFLWNLSDRRKGRSYGAINEAKWENHFNQLLAFKEKPGQCQVGSRSKTHGDLYIWISRQRKMRAQGTLRSDRLARLEAVGFAWRNTYEDDKWDRLFEELVQFKKEHGHTCVTFENGPAKLAKWRHNQRQNRRKGLMSPKRIARLNSIGFDWGGQHSWRFALNALQYGSPF